MIQGNVSDLEFVYQLAQQAAGSTSRVKDKKLLFKKPVKASTGPGPAAPDKSKPTQLVWGENLIEFRARIERRRPGRRTSRSAAGTPRRRRP